MIPPTRVMMRSRSVRCCSTSYVRAFWMAIAAWRANSPNAATSDCVNRFARGRGVSATFARRLPRVSTFFRTGGFGDRPMPKNPIIAPRHTMGMPRIASFSIPGCVGRGTSP